MQVLLLLGREVLSFSNFCSQTMLDVTLEQQFCTFLRYHAGCFPKVLDLFGQVREVVC